MDTQLAASAPCALSWRTHCQTHRDRIRSLDEVSRHVRSLEHFESQLIDRLCHPALDLNTRAIALRLLVELRHCTAREVGCFFQAPAEVVVRGLSLVVPTYTIDRLIEAVTATPARAGLRRSKAA
jgi:hypothetical protein